jgi:sugar lactone lactonase YvrE
MAVDSTGLIYVVDNGHNLIQVLDRNLNYVSSFGSSGTGVGQFNSPEGLAIDSSDRVYVTDSNNNRIQRCSNTGTGCVTVGGTAFSSTPGQFHFPAGISIDKNGNVWVADEANARIQEFNSSLAFVQTWGTYGTANGQFKEPWDVRVDQDGNVIVADYSEPNVQKLTASGTFIQQIGTGWAGPEYMAFDSNNNLYVTDWSGQTVSVFRPN